MRYSRTINERRGVIGFVAPMNVSRALESGRVLVNATFGKNGAEFWVQFLDPEFAHKTYSMSEAEELISSGSDHAPNDPEAVVGGFQPEAVEGASLTHGTVVERIAVGIGKNPRKKVTVPENWESESSDSDSGSYRALARSLADKHRLAAEGSSVIPTASMELQSAAASAAKAEVGDRFVNHMSAEEAANLVKARNLDRNRKQGVLNIFPGRSLVPVDFKKQNLREFQARAVCVANAIGGAKLVSRIASDPRMKIVGAQDLHSWWLDANEEQRFLAVTEAKSCSGDVNRRRLLLIPCPFQDAGLN